MERLGAHDVAQLLRKKIKTLGFGFFGTVDLVNWHGEQAALKVAIDASAAESFEREASVLSELKGAGGAPLLLAVSHDPSALLTTYKGSTNLDKVMWDQQYDLVKIGLQVGIKLLHIHSKGYVHNDVKSDNIMIQGSPQQPKISLIDFGLACKSGKSVFTKDDYLDLPFFAPEVLDGHRSTFAADVFSYGRLMQQILEVTGTKDPVLVNLFQEATLSNQEWRPSLPNLLRRLQDHIRDDTTTDSTFHRDRKRIERYEAKCAKWGTDRDGLRMPKEQVMRDKARTEDYLCFLREKMYGIFTL
ncbi:probable serine/threonine-protein kinase DDB_G0278665 [Procambarus clarkii]|uniref:probable serine/threonine-protein kinase DDB_G0278665 n=1 Tax=Procambarus clarkii TaxID=6728 RepID=UPI003741F8B7